MDSNERKLQSTVKVNEGDKTKVKIYPPNEGYEAGKTYTLHITKDVQDVNQKPLNKNVNMAFTIKKEVPIADPDEDETNNSGNIHIPDATADIDNSETLKRATKEQLDYFINPNRPTEKSGYGYIEGDDTIHGLVYKKGNYLQLGGLSPVIMSSTIPASSNDPSFNEALMNELKKISNLNGGSGEMVYNYDLSRLAYDRTIQWKNAGKIIGNDVDAGDSHFVHVYPEIGYTVNYYTDGIETATEVLVKVVDFRQFGSTDKQMAEIIGGVIRSSEGHTNIIVPKGNKTNYGLGYRTDSYGSMYVSIVVSNR